MKRLLMAAALGFTAVALAGPAQEIATVHLKFTAAAEANNAALVAKLIEACMTSDFVFKGTDGRSIPKAQWKAMMQQQMGMGKTKTFRFTEGATTPIPGGVKHTATLNWVGSMKMPDGKWHPMTSTSVGKEVWVIARGHLLCKSITEVSSKMTMDGKPFNPMAPPPTPRAGG